MGPLDSLNLTAAEADNLLKIVAENQKAISAFDPTVQQMQKMSQTAWYDPRKAHFNEFRQAGAAASTENAILRALLTNESDPFLDALNRTPPASKTPGSPGSPGRIPTPGKSPKLTGIERLNPILLALSLLTQTMDLNSGEAEILQRMNSKDKAGKPGRKSAIEK